MTKPQKFTVERLDSDTFQVMPDDWTTEDYLRLLDLTEYGDTQGLSPEEARGMALLSVADLPRAEAARLAIEYVFPTGALTPGQIQNSSQEMDTERLWEEYPDPQHHRNFFRVGSLLHAAAPGGFPAPDGRRVVVRILPATEEGRQRLSAPEPAALLRLLAPGLDSHALLHRLFEDELREGDFPAAAHIVWLARAERQEDGALRITAYSTDYWLKAYDPAGPYPATLA